MYGFEVCDNHFRHLRAHSGVLNPAPGTPKQHKRQPICRAFSDLRLGPFIKKTQHKVSRSFSQDPPTLGADLQLETGYPLCAKVAKMGLKNLKPAHSGGLNHAHGIPNSTKDTRFRAADPDPRSGGVLKKKIS